MSAGLLDRPGDRPARREEEAIDRMNRVEAARLARVNTIDWCLDNSHWRSRLLELEPRPMVKIQGRSLIIERLVQDRLLDERNSIRPSTKSREDVGLTEDLGVFA